MLIGNVPISPGAILAPMEAVTDLPFRTICEELGAALTFTEFLSAEALTRGARKAIDRMWPSLDGRTYVVQIFGREPGSLAAAAKMAADTGASVVDINMGCPAKKVTAGLCGSALMREPELAARLVEAVREAVPQDIPVTVKHRLGWDDRSINVVDFATRLVSAGAAMITVHGRTRAQGFSGNARLEPIAEVREALPRSIPVVGNGDVQSLTDYIAMREQTGCDAVMIGRAARGNPWLFAEVLAQEKGRPLPKAPGMAERHAVWRRHTELSREHAPEKMRLHEARKTLAWYSRGLQGGSVARKQGFAASTVEDVIGVGDQLFERLKELESQLEIQLEGLAGPPQALSEAPADPVSKAIARSQRRGRLAHNRQADSGTPANS